MGTSEARVGGKPGATAGARLERGSGDVKTRGKQLALCLGKEGFSTLWECATLRKRTKAV